MNPTDERPITPGSVWSVWPMDDTGNTFLVRDRLSKSEADALAAEFTARGHKQYYFAKHDPSEPRPSLTPAARS